MLIRSRKRPITEGRELPKQEKIRMLREKETSEYWGILEAKTNKRRLKKLKKEYFRRTKKLLKTKLYCCNLIKKNKFLECPPRNILELGERRINQRTRKLMFMHPIDDVDRLCQEKKDNEDYNH